MVVGGQLLPVRRGAWINVRVLVASTPSHTVGDVLKRLKCQRCGATPGIAWLGMCGQSIVLLGQGSY